VTPDVLAEARSRKGRGARRKGVTFAGLVRKHLEASGLNVIVPMQEDGADDLICLDHGLSIECKSHKTMALSSWVIQATTQAEKRGLPVPLVIHKRVGTTDPDRWYVTLELGAFLRLLGRRA
jgi:hypothetical protein